MIRTMLFGANGKMGQLVSKKCEFHDQIQVVAGVDRTPDKYVNYFPVFTNPFSYRGEVDLIIDFSHPSYLEILLEYAVINKIPVVIATTGFTEDELAKIRKASQVIPIFQSANMSIGINLIKNILEQIARMMAELYDIEIIEKHHNKKLDAPSGTAFLLANTINNCLDQRKEYLYGRYGDKVRQKDQIGIHAVRGGTIFGEHTILFAGEDEVIEIKHQALSREIFATGAIKAGISIYKAAPGLYDMDYLLTL